MTFTLLTRTTWIWLLLVLATAVSWEIGHGAGFHDLRYSGTAIIVVAVLKVRFVILDFMELRHAPLPMRIVVETWSVVICAVLVTLFLMAPR